MKLLGGVVAGGVLGGVALAFLIEFALDRTIKRPVEVETKLRLPLFLCIPDTRRNGRFKALPWVGGTRKQLAAPPADETRGAETSEGKPPGSAETSPWLTSHAKLPSCWLWKQNLRS